MVKKKQNKNVKNNAEWFSCKTNTNYYIELRQLEIIHSKKQAGVFYRPYGSLKYLVNPGPPGGQSILDKQTFEKLFIKDYEGKNPKKVGKSASNGFEIGFWYYIETNKKAKNDD